MIIAIWGCGGTGKTTLATGLGSIYANHGTVGVIDTNLCSPTLPVQLAGTRLDKATLPLAKLVPKGLLRSNQRFERSTLEHSLGRHLNRKATLPSAKLSAPWRGCAMTNRRFGMTHSGTNEIRPYFHQHPQCSGMFLAGLTDRDIFIDYEIGYEGIDRAREFLLQSEELLGTVILDCSVQRTDPFLPVMLREADCIVLPIVPSVGAVYWYSAILPMLQNAGVLEKTVPAATLAQPFHLISEVEGQLGIRFAAQFKYSRDVGRLHDECRLATEEIWREGIAWTKNLHRLYDAVEAYRDAPDAVAQEATE